MPPNPRACFYVSPRNLSAGPNGQSHFHRPGAAGTRWGDSKLLTTSPALGANGFSFFCSPSVGQIPRKRFHPPQKTLSNLFGHWTAQTNPQPATPGFVADSLPIGPAHNWGTRLITSGAQAPQTILHLGPPGPNNKHRMVP